MAEPKVFIVTDREVRVADLLRRRILAEVDRLSGVEALAKALDAPTSGVRSLLAREPWDLQTAFRVAEALDLDIVDAIERAAGNGP